MSRHHPFDVIVVGAGIQGSCTAYQLAKRGQRTLLIEQFDRLHTRGSSHGASRITRFAYVEPYYVAMMKDAFRMWETIERESGKKIFKQTGILNVLHNCSKGFVHPVEASLREEGVPYDVLDVKELNERFPQMKFDGKVQGIYEKFAGVLRADLARESVQNLFLRFGGTMRTNEAVVEIVPGSVIRVSSRKGDYFGKKLVLTVGSWANRVLKPLGLDLPLTVFRTRVLYWKITDETVDYGAESFPTLAGFDVSKVDDFHYYGLPVLEYPGLFKLCYHDGALIDSPEQRDSVSYDDDISFIKGLVQRQFKGLSPSPAIIENCMYTRTPDDNYVLDCHPLHHNIVIGAGFSGHGFKMGPIVGSILADLATDCKPKHNMDPFKISRFTKPKSSL